MTDITALGSRIRKISGPSAEEVGYGAGTSPEFYREQKDALRRETDNRQLIIAANKLTEEK
jgi:hypothetical protein